MWEQALISVSNCAGDHPNGEALDRPRQKRFLTSATTTECISAVEFMGRQYGTVWCAKGYTAADYARDQDILYAWVRANYPKCLLVGPCTTGDPSVKKCGKQGLWSKCRSDQDLYYARNCWKKHKSLWMCSAITTTTGSQSGSPELYRLPTGPDRWPTPMHIWRSHRPVPKPIRRCGTNLSPGDQCGLRNQGTPAEAKYLGLHLSGCSAHPE